MEEQEEEFVLSLKVVGIEDSVKAFLKFVRQKYRVPYQSHPRPASQGGVLVYADIVEKEEVVL